MGECVCVGGGGGGGVERRTGSEDRRSVAVCGYGSK